MQQTRNLLAVKTQLCQSSLDDHSLQDINFLNLCLTAPYVVLLHDASLNVHFNRE